MWRAQNNLWDSALPHNVCVLKIDLWSSDLVASAKPSCWPHTFIFRKKVSKAAFNKNLELAVFGS